MKAIRLLMLLSFCLPLYGQSNNAAGTLQKLEDHVYLFQGSSGWYLNSLILEDDDGLIVIDTQFEDDNNKALIAQAKQAFPAKKLKAIVVSHAHADHFMGIKLLQDALGECTVIGIKGEKEHMMKTARAFFPIYEQLSTEPSLTIEDVIYPDKEMGQNFKLSFSGRTVQFDIIEQNESWKSLIAYLPDTDLLFLADLYWGGVIVDPSVGASILSWAKELRQVMKRDVARVVPGHGVGVHERKSIDDFVDSLDAFMATSRKLIKQGLSRDDYIAYEFTEQLNFFGDKASHLGHAYDEIKADMEAKGTN